MVIVAEFDVKLEDVVGLLRLLFLDIYVF